MIRKQHCFNCGKDLGVYDKPPQDLDTCGERECEREAGMAYRERRQDAHDRLDRDMGYSDW